MPYNLNPAFAGNLKTSRQSKLKSALQSPLGSTNLEVWHTGSGWMQPGELNPEPISPNASQYSSPFDVNFASGAAFRADGIYAAFIGGGDNLTHLKATLIDSNGDFFLLADLQTGFNPGALPAGILSAVQVTNAFFSDPTDFIGFGFVGRDQIALSGWRIIFDPSLIIGSQLTWSPSFNLVTSESIDQWTGIALFQSQWQYFIFNPRLTRGNPAGDILNWFYDAGQPPIDHWQLQQPASPGNAAINIATYPAATRTMDLRTTGFYFSYIIFGCDSSGNQITPSSNIISG